MNASDPGTMTWVTPAEMGKLLATRAANLRLLKGWKRSTLAERAGVSAASLKRFETTGRVSLESLLRIAHALARLEEFDQLLRPPAAQTLRELERRAGPGVRKRGRL